MTQKITDEELAKIEKVQTKNEWTAVCDEIKRSRNGQYPPDWWEKVKLSGLLDRVTIRFL